MRSNHPSKALLAATARGVLSLAAEVTVAAHLETCGDCEARVALLEQAEGRLLERLPEAPLRPRALERLLVCIDVDDSQPAVTPPAELYLGDVRVPRAVAQAGLRSRRWAAPGLWTAHLRPTHQEGWRAFLLRAPPGTTIPNHAHHGVELIAVLAGDLRDGAVLRAGDFAENIAGSEHRLVVAAEGPCACLVALNGRADWRGWGMMVAPLLGV